MRFAFAACFLLAATFASTTAAQQLPPLPPPPPGWQAPAPVQSTVNLVPIRVIVRDSSGKVVTNLQRENFLVTQDGKPQTIAHFEAINSDAGSRPARPASTAGAPDIPPPPGATPPPGAGPPRLVVLLFDDLQLDTEAMSRAKIAADKLIDDFHDAGSRFAITTTSGESQNELTDDVATLHKTIGALKPRQLGAFSVVKTGQCPAMSFYEAELIALESDPGAISMAQTDTMNCAHLDPSAEQQANMMALEMAQQVVMAGSTAAQSALRRLADIVTRLTPLPGQRSVVLISPGFLTYTFDPNISELLDRASDASIAINTLDARGLYTSEPIGDITKEVPAYANRLAAGSATEYRAAEAMQQDFVMRDLAAGTGGVAFINNNDLYEGFVRTVAMPEMSYLLAYTPVNLKYDGRFHTIRVKLTGTANEHYSVQARRGFIAPKKKPK
jgi:VWFA-related protein